MLRLLTNRGGTRERAMAASGDDGGNVLLLRNPSTLIGSSADCDIQIRCAGIRPRHALIEFCPKTGGYWLRQLLPFEEKAQRRVRRQMATSESMPPPPYPYEEEEEEGHRRDDSEEEEERSRKVTQEQVLQDGTMVQLRPADTLRFGIGPQAVEFAFKMPPLAQRQNKRSGSFGNSTTGGGRMGGRMGSPDQQPASDLSLPIVGNRILPRMHADRFARPRQAGPRLCHLQQQQQGAAYATNPPPPNYSSFQQLPNGVSMLRRSVSASRIIAIGERGPIARGGESSGDENGGGNQRRGRKEGWRRQQRGIPGGTSVDSMALDDPLLMATVSSTLPRMMMASGSSGGGGGQNHQKVLLQRIRHLQTELHRRDQEIALLKVQMVAQQGRRPESSSNVTDGSPPSTALANSAENCFQEALARAHEENERLRAELRAKKAEGKDGDGGGRRRGWGKQRTVVDDADDRMEGGGDQLAPPHARLNELVYETFFQVCTQEMDSLNKRLSMMPLRDYSDIFGEMHKILHEPFSFRLMEVNTKCSVVFESMRHNLKPSDRDQLYVQFDQFLKQKIFPISKPVDSFLSTLRESAAMARESARACTVFSQWSREFGDQLQLQPNWDLMLFKVRDLQTRFREHGLPKHWLPPSLMPLLEVLIYERKNWADEQQRREKQLAESLAKANQRCGQLEAELVQKRGTKAQIDEGGENAGISAAATIPRIELPTTPSGGNGGTSEEADAGGEEHRPSSRRSPRSPRSARSSKGSLKQMMSGASEDEDSVQQHSPRPEARMNSPRTPPPSYRVVPPLVAQIEESAAEGNEEEEEDGDDDEPWGDRGEQEEEAEEEGKNENNKMEEEELGGATKGRAIRTAIVHLNEVYEEIRAKSRVTSPADGIVDGEGGGGEFMHFGQHGTMKGRAKSAAEGTGAMTSGSNMAEKDETGERRRRSASAEGPRARSPSSDSDQSLVKEESESEDDEQQGQMALLHLYSFYADLDEQRRKSQSTVDGGDGDEEEGEGMTARLDEEEEEVGGGKEEVGGGGEEVRNSQQDEGALPGEIEKDDEQKERDEKIVRAEKALLLGSNSKKDSTTTSTTPETVREVVTKMEEDEEETSGNGKRLGKRMSSEDQREFERIEKEVMEAATEATEDSGQQQPKRENVEFWEFVHKVANMLSVDLLPIRQEITNEENSSRPRSVVEVECRQRAADSILSRLKTILDEFRAIQERELERKRLSGKAEGEEGHEPGVNPPR